MEPLKVLISSLLVYLLRNVFFLYWCYTNGLEKTSLLALHKKSALLIDDFNHFNLRL
jgi:hypothetical protein